MSAVDIALKFIKCTIHKHTINNTIKSKIYFYFFLTDRDITLIIRHTLRLLNTQSANFSLVTDTLSLGDRTIDNMDRHAIQTRPRQQMLDHSSGPKSKPEPTFDYTQNSNVTALIGKTAYLTCRVRNLGDKTVRTFIILSREL